MDRGACVSPIMATGYRKDATMMSLILFGLCWIAGCIGAAILLMPNMEGTAEELLSLSDAPGGDIS